MTAADYLCSKILIPISSSIFDNISNDRFSLPLTIRDTYCWLHPSLSATCCCVHFILSIISNIFIATDWERLSQLRLALRHSASSRNLEGVGDSYFLNLSTAVPILFLLSVLIIFKTIPIYNILVQKEIAHPLHLGQFCECMWTLRHCLGEFYGTSRNSEGALLQTNRINTQPADVFRTILYSRFLFVQHKRHCLPIV